MDEVEEVIRGDRLSTDVENVQLVPLIMTVWDEGSAPLPPRSRGCS